MNKSQLAANKSQLAFRLGPSSRFFVLFCMQLLFIRRDGWGNLHRGDVLFMHEFRCIRSSLQVYTQHNSGVYAAKFRCTGSYMCTHSISGVCTPSFLSSSSVLQQFTSSSWAEMHVNTAASQVYREQQHLLCACSCFSAVQRAAALLVYMQQHFKCTCSSISGVHTLEHELPLIPFMASL